VPAIAGSYDDFNYGVSAKNSGDYDSAVRYLSAALSAGDLLPNLLPVAYLDRGESYAAKRQTAAALADLTAAIKLDPKLIDAYEVRADLYAGDGHLELALADCNVVADLDPGGEDPQVSCGRYDWTAGNYARATTRFAQALTFEDNAGRNRSAYVALWLKLATLKAGAPDDPQFLKASRSLDLDKWPGPIVQFYLGNSTPEAVAAAAATGDQQTQTNQKCETGFYVGEWQLAHGNAVAAKALLQQAVDLCPSNFIERIPAVIELKKLK
jgi:lipoprotein NlpI